MASTSKPAAECIGGIDVPSCLRISPAAHSPAALELPPELCRSAKRALKVWAFFLVVLVSTRLLARNDESQEIQEAYRRATAAMQAGRNEAAAKEFHEILRLDPRNAEAHANLGVIAYSEKSYGQAAKEFSAALGLRPALWSAKAFLGMSELRLGRSADARSHLEDSFRHVQDEKVQFQAAMDLISLYYQDQNLDKVVDVLRVLERTHPNRPDLLYTAYRAYTELAARTLSTLAEVAPESAEMHRVLAQAQQSQDDFSGAIAQYRKALELEPGLSGLHFELGQAILSGSTDEPSRQEAEKEFRSALAEDSNDARSQYMLGEIEWLRSKPQQAFEHYREAVRLQPDFVDARIALGKTLTTLGRPEEALQQLTEAVRLDPRNEVAHYRLSRAYRKLGRPQDAERESTTFTRLRDSHTPTRELYRQVQERAVTPQTITPNEAQ